MTWDWLWWAVPTAIVAAWAVAYVWTLVGGDREYERKVREDMERYGIDPQAPNARALVFHVREVVREQEKAERRRTAEALVARARGDRGDADTAIILLPALIMIGVWLSVIATNMNETPEEAAAEKQARAEFMQNITDAWNDWGAAAFGIIALLGTIGLVSGMVAPIVKSFMPGSVMGKEKDR